MPDERGAERLKFQRWGSTIRNENFIAAAAIAPAMEGAEAGAFRL